MKWLERLEARIEADPADRAIARACGVTVPEYEAMQSGSIEQWVKAKAGAQMEREIRRELRRERQLAADAQNIADGILGIGYREGTDAEDD